MSYGITIIGLKAKESFLVGCMTAIKEALETACDKLEFIQKMKEKGWEVKWKDGRKNITFIDADDNKVRDANLSKTFNADVSKEALEKQFGINAEREEYYKDVASEIEVDSTGLGKKKSVLADLKVKKEEVAKKSRKKRIIDNNRDR